MRALLIACLCLTATLLTSCIDGKEELWLNENGSGAVEATYDIPTSALKLAGGETEIREHLDAWLGDSPGIRCEAFTLTSSGDRTHLHVRIVFDSLRKFVVLAKADRPAKVNPLLKNFTGAFVLDLNGRELDFSRTVSVNKALAGGLFIPKKEIEGRRLLYIMHLPIAPLESNAVRTGDEGRTLVWDYPLADALKQPIVTVVKARVPLPGWLIAASTGFIVLILGLIYRRIRRTDR